MSHSGHYVLSLRSWQGSSRDRGPQPPYPMLRRRRMDLTCLARSCPNRDPGIQTAPSVRLRSWASAVTTVWPAELPGQPREIRRPTHAAWIVSVVSSHTSSMPPSAVTEASAAEPAISEAIDTPRESAPVAAISADTSANA